jgi:flagellar L-ring protein precursor FlgH
MNTLQSLKTLFSKGLCTVGFYVVVVPAVLATSLWDETSNGARSLYTDRKAFRVGDLVTIVINQSTTAVKDQNTETSKDTSVNDQLSAFLGPFLGGERTAAEILRRDPHSVWTSADSFKGKGKLNNTETLTSTIQARVTDVMPNKVLRLEASRRVDLGQEKSDLVLTGLVRQEDLTTANTILSTQVADLQVKQVTNGEISRSQKKGWLTRVWENISPF